MIPPDEPEGSPRAPHGDPLQPAPEQAAGDPTVRRLEREIDQTRRDLGHTMEELGERLTPRHIVDQAKETVKDAASERIRTVAHVASEIAGDLGERTRDAAHEATARLREHPIPAALLGAAAGWLAWSIVTPTQARVRADAGVLEDSEWERRPSAPGLRARATGSVFTGAIPLAVAGACAWMVWRQSTADGGATSDSKRSRGSSIAHAGDLASEAGRHLSDTVTGVGDYAASSFGRASATFDRATTEAVDLLRRHPMAIGLVALAVGAAVGFAAPESAVEHRYLGAARDSLLERGRAAASGAASSVKQTVTRAFSSAAEAARD